MTASKQIHKHQHWLQLVVDCHQTGAVLPSWAPPGQGRWAVGKIATVWIMTMASRHFDLPDRHLLWANDQA